MLSGQVLMVTSTNPLGTGSLTEKVTQAASGDTITFSPSLANKTMTLFFPITINKQLTITGFDPTQLHLSAPNVLSDRHIFDIGPEGNVSISGLTLTGGQGDDGGAIQNAGHLNLSDVVIESSSSQDGGAVYNTGSLTIDDSSLKGDTAGDGGAIFNKGTLTLTDSSVLNDRVAGDGGGIFNYQNGHTTISNCTFTEDQARVGGALFDEPSSTIEISESTIAFNRATELGGGLDLFNSTAVAHITDTAVAMNDAGFGLIGDDVAGAVESQGFNLIGNATDSSGWVKSDQAGSSNKLLNPLFGSLHTQGIQSYLPFLSGSPALTKGNPTGAPATDQLGNQRVVNGQIDIGAIENQSVAAAAPTRASIQPSFTALDDAFSTLYSADFEMSDLLSSGTT